MTLSQFNSTLTAELKKYIKQRGYVSSGKMLNSIRFTSVDGPDGVVDIKFDTEDYIKYLDNGTFLDDFFKQKVVLDTIGEYEADKLAKALENLL